MSYIFCSILEDNSIQKRAKNFTIEASLFSKFEGVVDLNILNLQLFPPYLYKTIKNNHAFISTLQEAKMRQKLVMHYRSFRYESPFKEREPICSLNLKVINLSNIGIDFQVLLVHHQ